PSLPPSHLHLPHLVAFPTRRSSDLALRNAVGARHDHERVLELNPRDTQAKLIVGAHNYVMGSLPWGVKIAAAVVGLSGNKEKGIDRKSTRLNSSHQIISYAVFCLKK